MIGIHYYNYKMTLDGTNWSASMVTMLVSKQQCCFCIEGRIVAIW